MTDTQELLRRANRGLAGRHPRSDFPIQGGDREASAHALVALASEQQTTNAHLAGIADSLARIAAVLEQPAPAPAPKSRRWYPTRRTA